MSDQVALLLEAERRGILPPDKASLLEEARRRGLIEPKEGAEPGFLDNLSRVPGRTVRAVAQGVAGIAAPFANPLGAALNIGTDAVGMGKPFGTDAVGAVSGLLDRMGVSKPQGGFEETADAVGQALAGGGGTIAAARQVPGAVASTLAAGPGMQAAGTVTGTTAGEIARHADAHPLVQAGVALAAGAAPTVVQGTVAGTTRATLRGAGEDAAERYNTSRREWERVGVGPSVGQAAQTRFSQGIESVLSKVPGGSGRMAKFAEGSAEHMKARIDEIADGLLPSVDSAKAGRVIEKGLSKFVDRFKQEQDFLYGQVDAHIPKGTNVQVTKTQQRLAELNADIPNSPELSKWFKNARIQGIEGAVAKDAAATPPQNILSQILGPEGQPFVIGQTPGTAAGVPWEALKKLRTLVGRELETNSLVADVPKSKWKALYAAISEDMGEAATAAGPQAKKSFDRATWYTKSGHERIEATLDRVSGKDTAEKVYLAAVNPSEIRDGGTTAMAVMRSLSPEERRVVSSAVVRRMGRAQSSKQDDTGEIFSSETFLTGWNNISPAAKLMLFSDPVARRGLDDLALATSKIREGSKVYANPSGTAPAGAAMGTAISGTAAALTGNLVTAAAIVAGVGAANAGARLMTNPRFVSWVGQTTKLPPAMLPTALTMLEQQTRNWPAEDRQALEQFMQRASQTAQQPQQ